MEPASVNTHAAFKPTTGRGIGDVELWDGHDALLWTDDGGGLSVFTAGREVQHGSATITRMVLRSTRQAGKTATSGAGRKLFRAVAELDSEVVGAGYSSFSPSFRCHSFAARLYCVGGVCGIQPEQFTRGVGHPA